MELCDLCSLTDVIPCFCFLQVCYGSLFLPPNKKIKKVIENFFTHNFEIENSEKKKVLLPSILFASRNSEFFR